jgi:Domain of unknown function (DUF6968)
METNMVVATRVLKLETSDGDIEIPIRLFAPEQNGDAWTCRYEIDWPEGTQSMEAGGVDSMQALVIATKMIGAGLYSSAYHKSGKLMFDAPGNGYGFPVVSSIRDLLEGDDAKYF